jgi:hypothetical protein
VDELNCSLERTGVRARRKGLEYETNSALSSFTSNRGDLISTHDWKSVAGQSSTEFEVVQVANTLYFYDKSSEPISAGEKSFTVDLNAFSAGNSESVSGSRIAADDIEGNLVVASPAINAFYIEYDVATDTITTTEIVPKLRDFEWQSDTTEFGNKVSVGAITEERKYDTLNAGWVNKTLGGEDILDAYLATSEYPPLTHPWFSGRDPSGDFRINWFERIYGGTSIKGNGHFILNLYSKNRTQAAIDDELITTAVTLPTETESTRFSTVAKYAGRMFFSGMSSKKNGSRIFFSRVIENMNDIGNFFQEADPTSEEISELVDSDGGVIYIPGASNIRLLATWRSKLLVVAENGAWIIGGADDIFKASGFSVIRVEGADGIINPATYVDAGGTPVWWGRTGIFSLDTDDTGLGAQGLDITKDTIQTFWQNIPASFRQTAVGKYDELNKRVFWLYGNDVTTDYKYNKVLILDVFLRSFYPWEFSDESSDTNYVTGLSYFSGFGVTDVAENVTVSGVQVTVSAVDVTVTTSSLSTNGQAEVKFIARDGDTGSLTFATISNTDFLDWGTEDFSSYAVAAYDFDDDLTTRKNNVYVTTYFKLTETGFTGSEGAGYDFINPSGCILKAFWDLKNTASSSKQVYRHLRPVVVDPNDLTSFDYPYDSIVTRNKVRGRGRTLKLRFESETSKDFQLEGYEVMNARNNGF